MSKVSKSPYEPRRTPVVRLKMVRLANSSPYDASGIKLVRYPQNVPINQRSTRGTE